MKATLLPAAVAALLLTLPHPGRAQSTSTNSTSNSARTVHPVPPVPPRATPAGTQGQQQQADAEKQLRDLILRQGRMGMNALVPGSGLALGADRFEDGLALPLAPAVTPPVRADAGKADPAAKTPVRKPAPHVQRFKMGERVSEPLPLRKAGNYGW